MGSPSPSSERRGTPSGLPPARGTGFGSQCPVRCPAGPATWEQYWREAPISGELSPVVFLGSLPQPQADPSCNSRRTSMDSTTWWLSCHTAPAACGPGTAFCRPPHHWAASHTHILYHKNAQCSCHRQPVSPPLKASMAPADPEPTPYKLAFKILPIHYLEGWPSQATPFLFHQ